MELKKLTIGLLFASALLAAGCGSHEDAVDTAPLPPADPQARLDTAKKAIESSNMTPEQKQKALEYAQNAAAQAEKMKTSAHAAGAPTGTK